tara:strand:+ start:4388 stop:5098 length:711 start_codon:yes stop_codon:yes gene_type:complete
MKHLKTFEVFYQNTKHLKVDKKTINFINGVVTESEYLEYLSDEILNEGIYGDIKNYLNDKILSVILTFIDKIKNSINKAFEILKKFKKSFTKILDYIKKFKEKYPILYKIIVIGLLCILFLVLFISCVQSGSDAPVEHIEITRTYIQELNISGNGFSQKIVRSVEVVVSGDNISSEEVMNSIDNSIGEIKNIKSQSEISDFSDKFSDGIDKLSQKVKNIEPTKDSKYLSSGSFEDL